MTQIIKPSTETDFVNLFKDDANVSFNGLLTEKVLNDEENILTILKFVETNGDFPNDTNPIKFLKTLLQKIELNSCDFDAFEVVMEHSNQDELKIISTLELKTEDEDDYFSFIIKKTNTYNINEQNLLKLKTSQESICIKRFIYDEEHGSILLNNIPKKWKFRQYLFDSSIPGIVKFVYNQKKAELISDVFSNSDFETYGNEEGSWHIAKYLGNN